ncbi:MAG: urease subunit beta [Trueperaceae bacterium]|nr:urease subunit beta [Trueperaceae bacterium]
MTVHDPIRGERADKARFTPGEILVDDGELELNAGRQATELRVENRRDRPIQVGSRAHLFEANAALAFDRRAQYRHAPRRSGGDRGPGRAGREPRRPPRRVRRRASSCTG